MTKLDGIVNALEALSAALLNLNKQVFDINRMINRLLAYLVINKTLTEEQLLDILSIKNEKMDEVME